MTTWMKIALVLNVLGTIGVGVIPIVGRTAGAGGGVGEGGAAAISSFGAGFSMRMMPIEALPTTMPTFGTRPTLKSGIAHTWSVSLIVAPSRRSGAGGCGACALGSATRPA